MASMGAGNRLALFTTLLLAPYLAFGDRHSVFSDIQVEGFKQQPLQSDDEVFQSFASRGLLDAHLGTNPPTYPAAPIMPTNPVDFGGNTYQLYGLRQEDWKTFDMASEDCRSRRMKLATISDADEHQNATRPLVDDYFKKNQDYSNLKFWVGYKNPGSGLATVDGSDLSYAVERTEVSDDAPFCVFANRTAGDLQELPNGNNNFTTTSCTEMYPYMCEESPCSICDTCVEKIREEFTSQQSFTDRAAATGAWRTYCNMRDEYSDAQCDGVTKAIAGSINVAGRPAALCGLLGDCSSADECDVQIADGGPTDVGPTDVEDIAFCTASGVESGSVVGSSVLTNLTGAFNATDDDCLFPDDCDASEFCDTSAEGSGDIIFCDPDTGLDSKKAKGVCTSKCQLPAVEEAQRRQNLLFSDEDVCNTTAADLCPDGFTCGEALDACRIDFGCDATSGEPVLSGSECAGMCYREVLQLENGNFTNDADAIIVKLNSLAQAFTAPCREIFDESSMRLLEEASCSVSEEERDMLMIDLTGRATVDVGDNLTISTSQDTLSGYTDRTNHFAGSIIVGRCESCTPPTPILSGPASIRQPCSGGDYGTVYIEGSSSFSASGRGLTNFTWGLDTTSDCASSDALLSAIAQASEDSMEVLELDNSTLTDMAENVNGGSAKYCITLAVEDFLSESVADAERNLTIQSANSATPSVSSLLPGTTRISTGLTLSASVDTSSVCNREEVAEYKWECVAADGGSCPLLGDSDYTRSIDREITFSELLTAEVTAGESYTFTLSARLNDTTVDGDAGITQPSAPQVSQVIEFEADPLVARFTRDSPSGDYKRPGADASQLIVFDASASYDPSDPEDNVQAMRYTFSCQRPDGISACFVSDGDVLYTGEENSNEWTVDLNKFVSDDDGNEDVFIMRVQVVKEGREPATATSTIRLLPADAPAPVRARVNQFCDGPCPAASLSSEPLSFSVDILNEGDLSEEAPSYSWTVNGATVGTSNLAGRSPSADAASITIQGGDSILPRSGVIDVSCTVSVGDTTGSAQQTVRLEGAPICANPNGCLIVTGAGNPPSQQFPNIAFRLQARGFSGANALNYEFGFVNADGDLQVTRVADSSHAAVVDAQQGVDRNYTVYVKAIDSSNGGSSDGTHPSAQATFRLEAAGGNVDEAADEGASKLDFEVIENAGSKSAVHSGMKKANAFKNAKSNAGGGGGRRLLDNHLAPTEVKTTEGLEATLRTLEGTDVRVAEALEALTAVSETSPSDKEQARLLAQIVRDAMRILDSNNFDGIGTAAVRQALGRLGLAANLLSELCMGDCFASSDDHWTIAMMVEATLDAARDVLTNSAASGVTTVAVSAPIALAVSRNTIQATSTANVVFDAMVDGTTQATGARFADDTSAEEFVNYCENIDPDCANQERLALHLSHVTNPAIYTNSTDFFPGIPDLMGVHFDGASMEPMAISGVFEIQFNFKNDGEAVCQETDECNMVLTIPVSPDSMSMLDGKRAACVRVSATDSESFTTEVVEMDKDVDSSSTSLTCTVFRLGQYMLMSYTAPPSPPPPPPSGTDGGDGDPPSPDPTPSPSPPTQPVEDNTTTIPPADEVLSIPEGEISGDCGGRPNKAVTLQLTFDQDAGALNDTNIQDLEETLRQNLGGLIGGLNCPVQMTGASSSRRLLASTWDVAADLGNDTPARIVRKARQLLSDTIQQDAEEVQETLIGSYEAQGGALTLSASSLTSSPDTFEGCASPDNTDRQISATVMIDFRNLLDSADAEQQEYLAVEAAAQMEVAVMDNLTNYDAVVGECPVLFSFGEGGTSASSGRRSLLQTSHQLAFSTSDDANGDVVQEFYDSLENVDFTAVDVLLAGKTYSVTEATLNALSETLTNGAAKMATAASTMALAVLASVIASGFIL